MASNLEVLTNITRQGQQVPMLTYKSLDQPILPQISQLMVCNSDRQQEPSSNSSNSTIEALNKAHSDSMSPASLRIKE